MLKKAALFTLPWLMTWVLAAPQLTESQLARTNASFELQQGVVVDPSSSSIFVMGANGGVDALSTVTGDLLWRYQDAAQPLGIYGDLLVARVESSQNILELVLIDPAEGNLVNQSTIKISLPADVFTHINDGMGRRFTANSHFINDSFFVDWNYSERLIQGFSPAEGSPTELVSDGAYVIDFDQNQASPTGSGDLPVNPAEVLPTSVANWLAANKPSVAPIRTGQIFAATFITGTAPQLRAVLKRWDAATGQELADVVLIDRRQILHYASADRQSILITTRNQAGTGGQYKWDLFATENGESQGSILDEFSLGAFFIADNLVVVTTPAYARVENGQMVEYPTRLRAIQLDTSTLVWDYPIRDTSFQGPFPP